MKRTWTIIGVGDVPGSVKWYQAPFGQPASLPAHDYFEQIPDSDGTVLLCLHEWGAHEHPSLMSPDHGTPGNGLLLFFRVDDFEQALQRARSLVTRLEEELHVNPNTQTKEFSLRSGRILRYDQCALCGLTRRCSCRALAGRFLPSDRPFH
jgi:catechol 2,3-dioxygenase-like lactoylglutathione lyase family enzyme